MSSEAIKRANAAILERMAGVPANPYCEADETAEGNPFVSPSCGDARLAEDSTSRSDRAPQPVAPKLRLVWCASQSR